jgi:hypothetical protein
MALSEDKKYVYQLRCLNFDDGVRLQASEISGQAANCI